MPRAAIISWDSRTGKLAVLSNLATIEGTSPEELEVTNCTGTKGYHVLVEPTEAGMAKLCRLLQRIAPEMPDGSHRPQPDPSTDGHLVQKYLTARPAKGVSAPKRNLSYEQVLNLLDVIDEEPTE